MQYDLGLDEPDVPHKVCCECRELKELPEFNNHWNMRGGVQAKCRTCALLYSTEHMEIINERAKAWQKANPEQVKYNVQKYYQGHKEYYLRKGTQRRHLVRNYNMTDFDTFVMEEAYHLARERGEIMGGEWHVDHIVPVQHKMACGLNSSANLQVVPAEWNLSKGNRSMDVWLPLVV